jgi:hypothetical protein
MNRSIIFGQTALCIENDFQKVTSVIGNIQEPKTQFAFGDEIMQKYKVNSIIPGKSKIDAPSMVEVWSFRLPSD